MDLQISNTVNPLAFNLTPDKLNDLIVNLFVASSKWDTLRLQLVSCVPIEVLSELRKVCDNIEIISVGEGCYPHLFELFPQYRGKLRLCQMLGKKEEEAYGEIKILQ